jgi:hypothetical protein
MEVNSDIILVWRACSDNQIAYRLFSFILLFGSLKICAFLNLSRSVSNRGSFFQAFAFFMNVK